MVEIGVRRLILKHRQNGMSLSQIASAVLLRKTTVSRILQRIAKHGSLEDLPRTGRPAKLSRTTKSRIQRIAKKNPWASVRQIWDEVKIGDFEHTVSRHTVLRALLESNLRCFRAAHRPRLTEKHRKDRFRFAKSHLDFPWDRVIFSDEKRFRLFSDGPKLVRRKRGERKNPKYHVPTVKFGGGSIMVWVAIRSDGNLWLRLCHDKTTSIDYIWMIQGFFEEDSVRTLGHEKGWYFQQDGARVHTSKQVLDYIDSTGFKLLPWPAQSPDLSIVEHVWPMISRRLRKTAFQTKHALWEGIQVACDELRGSAAIKSLYMGVTRRLQACIQNKGMSTFY